MRAKHKFFHIVRRDEVEIIITVVCLLLDALSAMRTSFRAEGLEVDLVLSPCGRASISG